MVFSAFCAGDELTIIFGPLRCLNLEAVCLFLAGLGEISVFFLIFFSFFAGDCFDVFALGFFIGRLFSFALVEMVFVAGSVVFGDFDVLGDLICFGLLSDFGFFVVIFGSVDIFVGERLIVVVLEVVVLVVVDVFEDDIIHEVESGISRPTAEDLTVGLELVIIEEAVVANSVSSRI